jgi:hypothetical protein
MLKNRIKDLTLKFRLMNKRHIKIASFILALMISNSACQKFDDLNTNPDLSLNVTPDMLATTLILDATRTELNTTKGFMYPFMLDKYILWTEFAEDMQYNKLNRADFSYFVVLTNVDKMIAVSTEGGLKNSYTALGHFIRAWKFFRMTLKVGDIPYKEALKAETDKNIKPAYDTQKDVILGILSELDEADQLFAKGSTFAGDPVYNGDPKKWRKLVNTFQVNVLVNLSNKSTDTDLNIVGRVTQILTSRPLMESNSDNFGLSFSNASGQTYPFSKPNPFSIYPIVSSTIIDKLKQTQDRRLFYYAAPSPVKLTKGLNMSDWDAYVGVDPSAKYSDVGVIVGKKDYSTVNDRYYTSVGEPISLVSYSQLKFNLAEAAVRGWIKSSAETYYYDGIKAALNFLASNTVDDASYHHNMKIDANYIQSFISSASIKFADTKDEQLKQIMDQKYIASYLQIPLDAFFNNRRTGLPVLPVNPESNQNVPSDKMPKRWMYPQGELDYNTENVKGAITRQYSSDDANETMWILKN